MYRKYFATKTQRLEVLLIILSWCLRVFCRDEAVPQEGHHCVSAIPKLRQIFLIRILNKFIKNN